MVGGLFKRKKKEKVELTESKSTKITDLERICGNDKEVCKALQHTMFYDPRKIKTTLKEAVKKAEDFEKKKETDRARMWYHVAGGLALWKGDATKVKQYFSKCAKLAPEMNYELITKNPKKAVAKAQEFYKRFLK